MTWNYPPPFLNFQYNFFNISSLSTRHKHKLCRGPYRGFLISTQFYTVTFNEHFNPVSLVYNWNIVESGVKYHTPSPIPYINGSALSDIFFYSCSHNVLWYNISHVMIPHSQLSVTQVYSITWLTKNYVRYLPDGCYTCNIHPCEEGTI